MHAPQVADSTQLSLNSFKELAKASAPCISILIPIQTALDQQAQNAIRLKDAFSEAERLLADRGIDPKVARAMLESAKGAAAEVTWTGQGLAVYCSPDVCRAFELPHALQEGVTLGEHFSILPLIPLLDGDRPFYVLGLSQKHIRLLRCTDHSSEEVTLPEATPKNLWDDKQSDQPDHDQVDRSSGGPDQGGMKGIVSTTNTDRESHLEYLAHFYKHVCEAVTTLLREEGSPLVVAGVDYETALFRRVNTYPHLCDDVVHGSADGLKGGELHKRALEAVQGFFAKPLHAALARYEQVAGSARGSSTIKDIVRGAFDGRVQHLVLSEGAKYMGSFHEDTHEVKKGEEDLLNAAALFTICNGGDVFLVPASQVPHGAPAIAVFRY